MGRADWRDVLDVATPHVRSWLEGLPDVRVGHEVDARTVREAIEGELTDDGVPPATVVDELAVRLAPHLTAMASGRFFGFVIGGLHPAALGADMLVSAWDQNSALYAPTPGTVVVEEHASRWLRELLDLPDDTSVAFVTGGQMANWTCLAAARHHLLRMVDWDVAADGLVGSPPITVLSKTSTHSTIPRSLRFLGLGERIATALPVDAEDRLEVAALDEALSATSGPTLVCVEAGSINTGAFDHFDAVADLAARHRAAGNPTWVHVDGAIGLLAAASPSLADLTAGMGRLDSWSTDGHKLLNVGYDSGIAFTAHPHDHHAATSVRAHYLPPAEGGVREPMDWVPEFSRRARGVAVYATLRSLGRDGLAAMLDGFVANARLLADGIRASGRAEVLNEVAFNQVLVRWSPPDGVDGDEYNDAVTAATVRDGRVYFSGGTHRGARVMRASIADRATTPRDIELAVEVLVELADREAARLADTS